MGNDHVDLAGRLIRLCAPHERDFASHLGLSKGKTSNLGQPLVHEVLLFEAARTGDDWLVH